MSLFLTFAALLFFGHQHEAHISTYMERAHYFYSLPTTLPTNTTPPKEPAVLYVNIPLEPRIVLKEALHSSPSPSPSPSSSSGSKLIALTFDDGPNKKETPRLLDILKKEQVKSTFFVLGKNAKAYPEIIKRASAEGHEIENHSWDHPYLTKLSLNDAGKQIADTDTIITELTKRTPLFLRPPYGAFDTGIKELTSHIILLWSIDPQDWKIHDSASVEKYIKEHIKPGDIILLHDIHTTSVDAAALLIPALKKEGYTFVTVEELFAGKLGSSEKKVLRHG